MRNIELIGRRTDIVDFSGIFDANEDVSILSKKSRIQWMKNVKICKKNEIFIFQKVDICKLMGFCNFLWYIFT